MVIKSCNYGNFFGKMRTRETTSQSQVQGVFQYGYEGGTSYRLMHPCQDFKFYRFASISQFTDTKSDFLMPPDGKNLLHVLLTSKELKQVLTGLFKKFGYRIVFKPQEGKIEVQKELEDIIIAIPYALTSETLQRIAFYLAAVYSNKESIISFEEPEAHAFPYYMKFLAERIAMDKNKNQYFIATHNPYFLMAIIEKTPKTEIAAFATYFEDYQTKAKVLSSEEIESALSMGADFFFNIDQFVKKDECVGN